MTAAAPSGVVTFLFTDVEGSTRRWEADADSMRAALVAHDDVLRKAIGTRKFGGKRVWRDEHGKLWFSVRWAILVATKLA